MPSIQNFLRLVRFPNLLFIVLTQFLVQYLILIPILAQAGRQPSLNTVDFSLLVFATVLIAAAGYIINDYFDVKIDEVNKPKKIYIDRSIRRRTAMKLHGTLTAIALVCGIYVSWRVGNIKLAFLFPIISTLLWFYSTNYKRQILIGNIVVSLLTAMTVGVVVLFESQIFYPVDVPTIQAAYAIFIITFFYFTFAFLISMVREIVKDMEDMQGDEQFGCRTLPIVLGLGNTKLVVYTIIGAIIAFGGYVQWLQISGHDFISCLILFIVLDQPLLICMFWLYKADSPKDFHRISSLVKTIMLFGILTMVYFYFLKFH
jgi:4-hydroxybenzoate polyprenyltransferase